AAEVAWQRTRRGWEETVRPLPPNHRAQTGSSLGATRGAPPPVGRGAPAGALWENAARNVAPAAARATHLVCSQLADNVTCPGRESCTLTGRSRAVQRTTNAAAA